MAAYPKTNQEMDTEMSSNHSSKATGGEFRLKQITKILFLITYGSLKPVKYRATSTDVIILDGILCDGDNCYQLVIEDGTIKMDNICDIETVSNVPKSRMTDYSVCNSDATTKEDNDEIAVSSDCADAVENITICDSFVECIRDWKWQSLSHDDATTLIKNLESIGVTVKETCDKITISAPTSEQIELAKHIIKDFVSKLADECTIKDVSSLIWNTVRVIYQEYINNLETVCGSEIAFSEEKSEVCIPWSIKGNISDLKKALNDLEEYQIEDIAIKPEELSKVEDACQHVETQNPRGGCKFDKARKTVFIYGETFEVFTKLKHQWEIKIGRRKQTAARVVSQETTEDRKPDSSSKNMYKEQKTFATDMGINVMVYQGSILNVPVECIVNAANGGLNHGAGLSRVIADAAGKDLEREGKIYIKKYGELSDGSACSTTAGKLYNYKCVIHTVGLRWSDYSRTESGRRECKTALVNAVKNAFYEADKRKMKSIALPAISSAIFGVPLDICVRQYVRAVESYCAERMSNYTGTLSEIHFIDIKSDVVFAIQDAFTRFFSPVPGTSESSNIWSSIW